MIVLGVDVETTGLDPKKDRIIELGFVLWDVPGTRPLKVQNFLVSPYNDTPHGAEEFHGIAERDVVFFGEGREFVQAQFIESALQARHIVAHNAKFDRAFVLEFLNIDRWVHNLPTRPWEDKWIDTEIDVPWRTKGSRSLPYLAADHGFLNPFSHRAVFDVLTMLRLMGEYDMGEILKRTRSPEITVSAEVSYDDRHLAKAKRFYWNPERGQWLKDIKECDLDALEKECEFRIKLEKDVA